MNACVGKKSNQSCIGQYSKGTINTNGEHLVELCETNGLILTNTCFPHKQSHLTTWQQTRIDKSTNKVQFVRKVIDFIMIEQQYKHIIQNARTYQGTLTTSDHRFLITTLQLNWHIMHIKKNRASNNNKRLKIDTQKLIHDRKTLDQ